MAHPSWQKRPVTRVTGRSSEAGEDAVAVERALEIRVGGRSLAVTLRSPGDDQDLVLGFLAGEGVIRRRQDVAAIDLEPAGCDDEPDVAGVTLAPEVPLDWAALERHFAASAACGLCGRAHLESLRAGLAPVPDGAAVSRGALLRLPERLREGQPGFLATGGVHAAVWCGPGLEPRFVREDIGRHNAVDKVCGALIGEGARPAGAGVLWVSGRAGAEIVLKAARAGMPMLAAVGAPTTLAVDLALAAHITLVGFLRDGRMNVYAGAERISE